MSRSITHKIKISLAAIATGLFMCQSALSQESADHSNQGAASSPPPPAPLCVPDCREGFFCHDGTCISACNPPCAFGARCTATGDCVSENTPVAAPPQDSRIAKKEAIREKRRALRAQYRKVPRFSIGAALMTSLMPVDDTGEVVVGILPNIGFGMRINITDRLGFWVKGGPVIGGYILSGSGSSDYNDEYTSGSRSDGTFLTGGFVETGIYGGPFGPFAVGPVVGLLVTNPFDETLEVESDGETVTFTADEDVIGLYGVDISLLLGTTEFLHLYIRVMSGIPPKTVPLYVGGGISFDIPVTKSK